MRLLAFLAAGLATGMFSGALGVGGALLATPLIRFMGVPPYLAVGTTVPAILPGTLTGAWTYHRQGFVDLRATAWTAPSAALASVGGAFTTRQVNGHVLMLITALLLFVSIARTLSRGQEQDSPTPRHRSGRGFVGLGAASGFLSGLLGIGGGIVMVPAFIDIFGFPTHTALGTSLAVITLTVIPNIAAQAVVGNIDWAVAAMLAIGVVPGARAGALLAIRTAQRTMRNAVLAVLTVVAAAYAWLELAALSSRG